MIYFIRQWIVQCHAVHPGSPDGGSPYTQLTKTTDNQWELILLKFPEVINGHPIIFEIKKQLSMV